MTIQTTHVGGSVYIVELKHLSVLFPDVSRQFEIGLHTIRRSSNENACFNGIRSDLAIEQAINRDCSTEGSFKGTYRIDTSVERHYLTSHKRAEVSSNLLRMCDLGGEQNISHKEVSRKIIAIDERKVKDVMSVFTDSMINPFVLDDDASEEHPTPLANIATGVVFPDGNTTTRLLNSQSIGTSRFKSFLSERINTNTEDIMTPVPRENLKTFSSLRKPVKVTASKMQVAVINTDRQFLAKLLIPAKDRDISLESCFEYELSSVPLSLFNIDGSMNKGVKSNLLHELEGKLPVTITSLPSCPNTMWVLDFMAVIQMICGSEFSKSNTIGSVGDQIERLVLSKFTNDCSVVSLVCDRYDINNSIKSGERSRRSGESVLNERIYKTKDTKLPNDKRKLLGNPKTKANLACFIYGQLVDNRTEKLKNTQTVYLSGGFKEGTKFVVIKPGYSNRNRNYLLITKKQTLECLSVLHTRLITTT